MADQPKTPEEETDAQDDRSEGATVKPVTDAVTGDGTDDVTGDGTDAVTGDGTEDGTGGATGKAGPEPRSGDADQTAAEDAARDQATGEPAEEGAASNDAARDRDTDDTAQERLSAALQDAPLIASGAGPAPAVNAAATEPARDADADAEHHDEGGGSLAGRVLTWLVLLIAGAGLALWGAPKVAPHLPAGLGPVRAWLMPGEGAAEAEIAALRETMNARLAGLPEPVGEDRIAEIATERATAVADGVDERLTAFADRIDALADQIAASDSSEIESRLAQIETRLGGLEAQVETRLSAIDTAGGDGIPPEALAEINRFSAAVDGLRAEIAELAARDGALSQRIDDVAATANRRLTEAQAIVTDTEAQAERALAQATISASLASIRAALASGAPYGEPLDALASASGADIPAVLAENADAGVATLASLRASFPDAAHQAIRADIQARAGDGTLGRFGAFLESQVATRSLTPQQGSSTDAVLSRAEDALRRDDLASAVTELSALQGPAADAMADWVSSATARLGVAGALDTLASAADATN